MLSPQQHLSTRFAVVTETSSSYTNEEAQINNKSTPPNSEILSFLLGRLPLRVCCEQKCTHTVLLSSNLLEESGLLVEFSPSAIFPVREVRSFPAGTDCQRPIQEQKRTVSTASTTTDKRTPRSHAGVLSLSQLMCVLSAPNTSTGRVR